MAKQRAGNSRPSLTESWADEEYDLPSSGDSDYFHEQPEVKRTPVRQQRTSSRTPEPRSHISPPRRSVRRDSVEPQFIMPVMGGNGDVEVGLSSLDELPYIMGLVRQSFERQMGDVVQS